jgi:hypothetical protein
MRILPDEKLFRKIGRSRHTRKRTRTITRNNGEPPRSVRRQLNDH